ncbi:MAG: butyrate kinase [Muribaculaceae bacterium]|nr:butyrate kinase [Muribaculaceae bacterium]
MIILVINPGSTSTKMAVVEDGEPRLIKVIRHAPEELAPYAKITDQFDFRRQMIVGELEKAGIPIKFDAVVARGGLTKPLPGGVYAVDENMIQATHASDHQHACDLGCVIAREIAKGLGCPCYIADPVVTDELNDYARICGLPMFQRQSIWHALNQRAIARRYAKENNKRYEDLNLIVAHLGGGISVAAHDHGRAVDVNNALDGEGPFSPERAGSLPARDLVNLCFSGEYTKEEIVKMLSGKGGVNAHLGTTDMIEVENRIKAGDEHAKLIIDAMIYHVAKAIAEKGAVLCGKIDAIIITGGIAYWKYIVDELNKRIGWMAPVAVYPGEDEMSALAANAAAVLNGEIEVKTY